MASQSDLYNLAKSVGLPDSAAKTAAAIAMAESGGNQNAHNTNASTGDDSYGYWQINMRGDLGPARRKQFGISSNDQLYDPQTNALAMRTVSTNGVNWYPWTTYTTTDPEKSYKRFMDNPVDGSKSWLSKVGDVINPTNPLDAAKDTVVLLKRTAQWVSNSENWLRVGYVAGGAVLTIAGLVMIVNSTKAGQAITRTAGGAAKAASNVVPVGRVANVAKSASKGAS